LNGKCEEKLGQQILIQNLGNFYFVFPMFFCNDGPAWTKHAAGILHTAQYMKLPVE
jgi:hypothetical protein